MSQNSDIVVDRAKSQWSDLWKKEDYWAIWLGLFILAVALCVVMNNRPSLDAKSGPLLATIAQEKAKPIKTIEWYEAKADLKKVAGRDVPFLKSVLGLLATPGGWHANPLDSLYLSKEAADQANAKIQPKLDELKKAEAEALANAKTAQAAAANAMYKDEALNTQATAAIDSWQRPRVPQASLPKRSRSPSTAMALS